jgi:hypothetical protein
MADPEKRRRRARVAPVEDEDEGEDASQVESVAEEPIAPAVLRKGERLPELEEKAPRQALQLGGGLLLIGLGIVGTGLGGMGAVVALVGLASIIYGIHAFGRLGSEDLTPASIDAVARSSSTVRLVLGLVIAFLGLTLTVAAYTGLAPDGSLETAVIAFVGGGFLALRAAMALSPTKKTRRAA